MSVSPLISALRGPSFDMIDSSPTLLASWDVEWLGGTARQTDLAELPISPLDIDSPRQRTNIKRCTDQEVWLNASLRILSGRCCRVNSAHHVRPVYDKHYSSCEFIYNFNDSLLWLCAGLYGGNLSCSAVHSVHIRGNCCFSHVFACLLPTYTNIGSSLDQHSAISSDYNNDTRADLSDH